MAGGSGLYDPFDANGSSQRRLPNVLGHVRRARRSHCISLSILLIFVVGVVLRMNWNKVQLNTPIELPLKFTYSFASWNPTAAEDIGSVSNSTSPLATTTFTSGTPTTNKPSIVNTDSSQLRKKNPRFHLLIPATNSNPQLCKALLSAFILNYPTPTFINWNKTFKNDDWGVKSHIAKIQGVHDFLSNVHHVGDDDLVLIIDGFDIFFQLPPDVMIKYYEALIAQQNQYLLKRYGHVDADNTTSGQRFKQSILFAADKICWPNSATSPACAAVPESSLPTDVYGQDTDIDTKSFHNRPRFLNSGAVIGPAQNIRDLYSAALKRVEKDKSGAWSDQYILAAIWGEQEIVRERSIVALTDQALQASKWRAFRSSKAKLRDMPVEMILNFTVDPDQHYDYGIGIDYTSSLFQTMTHAADKEVEFVLFSNSTQVGLLHKIRRRMLTKLPPALLQSKRPFAIHANSSLIPSSGNLVNYADFPSSPSIHPPYRKLDKLPPLNTSWSDVPLASNLFASSIPCLLHLNGNFKPLMQEFWVRMWYHNHTRALLRQYMRKSLGADSVRAASWGGQNWWDERGGRGGAWTDQGDWFDWSDMCIAPGIGNKGKEEDKDKDGDPSEKVDWEVDIFGDRLGVWGKEKLDLEVGEGRILKDWEALMNERIAGESQMDAQGEAVA
ncbi:hypothetical protein NA57DRAFT_75340 [Rhizodiscina lignyota]|uniref:Uncharacterized protein n=1 Tax=Rhizodiscina lignyota TaxID=1504668 RepID=A0A9P4M6L7_9PEZI|nr:hypothetical protein NA57DRAFT_75340 [Rhizodiscina lignyota]